jgi:hypothetical protein
VVHHRRREVRIGAGAEKAERAGAVVARRQGFEPPPYLLLGKSGRQSIGRWPAAPRMSRNRSSSDASPTAASICSMSDGLGM